MELLEAHAVDTYTTFLNENRKRLSQLPPPAVARSYYKTGDLYLFDDFQGKSIKERTNGVFFFLLRQLSVSSDT